MKGQAFKPDARMKKILTEAAAVGNAIGRALAFRGRDKWAYYPGSSWQNMLFEGGYSFETPPPQVTPQGIKPYPRTDAPTLDARTSFFTAATGVTPGMIMRLTHRLAIPAELLRPAQAVLDGTKPYRITLPKDIPAERFWSLPSTTTRRARCCRPPQRFPRAGSQSYPSPAAVADRDGSTVVHIGPTQPDGVERGNWIQTMPAKAGSWAYASTAHWTGSSTRPGDHPEVEAAALTDSASRIRANNAWPEPTRAREMLREQQLSHQLGVRCPSDACGADGGQTCTLSPAILVPEELIVTMDLEPPVSVGHGARPTNVFTSTISNCPKASPCRSG